MLHASIEAFLGDITEQQVDVAHLSTCLIRGRRVPSLRGPIRASITPGVPAVLLANHGVLVFHRTPELAILVGGIVEEAAQAGINAGRLGGPVEIPVELRDAALQRAMLFESQGTAHA